MPNSLGKPGPFQIIDVEDVHESNSPIPAPKRRYSCPNYEKCLNMAAALNWDNFTCRGCSGEVDTALLWRARQAVKNEKDLKKILSIPLIEVSSQNSDKDKNAESKERTNLFSSYIDLLDEEPPTGT